MFNLNYLGVRPGPLPEALQFVQGDGDPVPHTLIHVFDTLDALEMVFEILFFFLDVL